MGCDTCIHLNNVINRDDQKGNKLEPCSMQFNCNPFFKDGHDLSVIITQSYCATCNELDKQCQCEGPQRQIRMRKLQLPRNR